MIKFFYFKDTMIKAKIIYVDNSDFMHKFMTKKLNAFDCDLFCIRSIADVEKALVEGKYDMIISGMEILGGTAVDLIEYLKKMELYTVPLIVLSSTTDEKIKKRVLEAGAMDFVDKTTELNELIDSIDHFFNLSGPFCKVLVVDDSFTVRKIAGNIIDRNRMQGIDAKNGAMALGMVDKNNYCAIMSDVNMPIMGGLQLYQELRYNKIELPFLFMTTDTEIDKIKSVIENDKNADCIIKPFTEKSLMDTLNRMKYKRQDKKISSIPS